jgi:hypothetical protein
MDVDIYIKNILIITVGTKAKSGGKKSGKFTKRKLSSRLIENIWERHETDDGEQIVASGDGERGEQCPRFSRETSRAELSEGWSEWQTTVHKS